MKMEVGKIQPNDSNDSADSKIKIINQNHCEGKKREDIANNSIDINFNKNKNENKNINLEIKLEIKNELNNNYLPDQNVAKKIITQIRSNEPIINRFEKKIENNFEKKIENDFEKNLKNIEKQGILEQTNMKNRGELIKDLIDLHEFKDFKNFKDYRLVKDKKNEIQESRYHKDYKEKDNNSHINSNLNSNLNLNLKTIIFPNRLRSEQIRQRSRAKDNEKELQLIAKEITQFKNESKMKNSKMNIIKFYGPQYKANIEQINMQSSNQDNLIKINSIKIPDSKAIPSNLVFNQNQKQDQNQNQNQNQSENQNQNQNQKKISEEASNKFNIQSLTEQKDKDEEEKIKEKEIENEKISENNTKPVNIGDVPMSLKFSNLLQDNRELTIPIHYKDILTSFENLNLTLNYFKYQNRLTIFEEIQKAMQVAYKQYI